jgi:hypothetical protein
MCEVCGTIERYGKRVPTGRRLCIDCWKLKEKTEKENISNDVSDETKDSD